VPYIEEEWDFNASDRWVWEEKMHIMEEAELDWYATNNADLESYEDDPTMTYLHNLESDCGGDE